jgi:hypothetical protein
VFRKAPFVKIAESQDAIGWARTPQPRA